MDNIWNEQLPKIKNGITTFSEADINPIIDAIGNRLSYLKTLMDSFSGQCGYVASLSGFTSDCKKGTIVALGDDGLYVPASADWSTSADNGGNLLPSPSANIIGVLLENVSAAGSAMVLCSGWITDPELISILVGVGGTGDYFLSTGGKAVKHTPDAGVVVRCFTYIEGGFGAGNSCIIFRPQPPEYMSHTHNLIQISGAWEDLVSTSTDTHFITIDSSITRESRIDISANPNLATLITKAPNHLVLYKNGAMVDHSKWVVKTLDNGKSYIYVAFDVIDGDIFYLAAIVPGTGITPIVHSLNSRSKLLEVDKSGGDVYIDFNKNLIIDNNSRSGSALCKISDQGLEYGPVVHQLMPGVGIGIEQYRDTSGQAVPGCFILHNKTELEQQRDINIVNLNGVLIGTAGAETSYVFPEGRTSSLVGTVRMPSFTGKNIGFRLNVFINGLVGGRLPSFTAAVTPYGVPTIEQQSTAIIGTNIYELTGSGATEPNRVYRLSTELLNIQSDDHLVIKLESTPEVSTAVLTASVELYIK